MKIYFILALIIKYGNLYYIFLCEYLCESLHTTQLLFCYALYIYIVLISISWTQTEMQHPISGIIRI